MTSICETTITFSREHDWIKHRHLGPTGDNTSTYC